MSHGFSPCAGRRASCCGRCSVCCGSFRISISLYGRSAGSDWLRQFVAPSSCSRSTARQRAPSVLLGVALAADAVLLTGLLDITGGPFNPFIVMYAVYIWAAAVAVSPVWATVVGVVSLSGFGWLVVDHLRAGLLEHHRLNDFPTHLFTMWFSGAGIAELVAHYVGARADGAGATTGATRRSARAGGPERTAGVADDARGWCGARVVDAAGDDRRGRARARTQCRASVSSRHAVGAALRDDARLIRSELDRCQSILDGMSGRAGDGLPATLEPTAASFDRASGAGTTDRCSASTARPSRSHQRRRVRRQQARRWCRRSRRCSRTPSTRVATDRPRRSSIRRSRTAWCGSKYGTEASGCRRMPGGVRASRSSRRKNPGDGLGPGPVSRPHVRRTSPVVRWSSTSHEGTTAILEVPALPLEASPLT